MADHAILTATAHRDLRIQTGRAPELGDAVMCCITVPDEFRQVQDDYPILFRLDAERDNFTALAMFGFQNGENLYLDGGRWDADYLPLAIDIQPFLIGGSATDDGEKQVHVDMASPRIANGEGMRVFDEDGRPTPYLETITEKLGALDAGYRGSQAFFAALRRHALLEPLTLEITLDDGSTNRLVGFHVIDEERLRTLDAGVLGDLHEAGHLMPIFMALASLGKLRDLIARKNRHLGHG
ncbi:MAG: multidrug transporter [Sphingomonas bacterium]|uniref:SapC family protein n=1 Tax=Sphingomonas bacterium TaxID=1895847 RepID=UPI00262FA3B3|nr:SapC family protein [Sphingomonas bacterium]MDB5707803.1 multidrug transporter [Sphingomonas bacterium]